ncbi:MAG: hypothetical protein JJU00_01395 [Opitutales bacterium]|nr:hypothetical protein [Opitutales bacterium]
MTGGVSSIARGVGIAAVAGGAGGLTSGAARQFIDDPGNLSVTSVVLESSAGAIGGGVDARVLPGGLRMLSDQTKGWIGETTSLVHNVSRGNVPAGGKFCYAEVMSPSSSSNGADGTGKPRAANLCQTDGKVSECRSQAQTLQMS